MDTKYIVSYIASATGERLYYNVEDANGYADKSKSTRFADIIDAEVIASQFGSAGEIEAI